MELFTLSIHIISFSVSLTLFPILALAAVKRTYLPRVIMRASTALTTIGFVTGAGLLIIHPAGAKCLMLTAYLIGFIGLYRAAAKVPAPVLAKESVRR